MSRYFSEIAVGTTENMVCLVSGFEEAKTSNNATYVVVQLLDGKEQIPCKWWNHNKQHMAEFPEETVVWAGLKKELYNGNVSYVLLGLQKGPADVNKDEFKIRPPYDPEDMYTGILDTMRKMVPAQNAGPGSLVDLTEKMYAIYHDQLVYWSAAKTVHHNMWGGLMYHVYRMIVHGAKVLKLYPQLDAELLLSAIALHDIGKLIELETSTFGVADYTPDGNLFGHLEIGIEMIDRFVWERAGVYDPEKVKLLKHCIAAHHKKPEWGALKTAVIPEAEALYFIDDMDAKMFIYEREYESMQPGEMKAVFGLDSGRAYKATYRT